MLTTDYSKIASRYDNNKLRLDVPKDDNIGRLYASRGPGLRVLDLACGTGNYLRTQIEAYADSGIEWLGLDKCPEMLAEARKKVPPEMLVEGDACALPFGRASIDYGIARVDSERFLGSRAIFEMLEGQGFSVQASIYVAIRRFYFADLIAEAENRDMSQLNLIDEDEYRAGLARMRDDAKRAEYLIGDIAFLDYLARVPAA